MVIGIVPWLDGVLKNGYGAGESVHCSYIGCWW